MHTVEDIAGEFAGRVARLGRASLGADGLMPGEARARRLRNASRLAVAGLVALGRGVHGDQAWYGLQESLGLIGVAGRSVVEPFNGGQLRHLCPPRRLWASLPGLTLAGLGLGCPVDGLSPGFFRGLGLGGCIIRDGKSSMWRLWEGRGALRVGLVAALASSPHPGISASGFGSGRLCLSGALCSMGADDPMGMDVVAGLLASGKLVDRGGGMAVWLVGRPGVEGLLSSWGIPFVHGRGPAGRMGVVVSLFWGVLFSVAMHPVLAAVFRGMPGVAGGAHNMGGRVCMGYPLLPAWWWDMAVGGGVRSLRPGIVPFCPGRVTMHARYGSGWRGRVHLEGVRAGWGPGDPRVRAMVRGWADGKV